MWICPKCGREFKRTNQGHYCGRAPGTVDEYLESQPSEARAHLSGLRNIIRNRIPEVKERIAWSMPVFEKGGRSLSFAACRNHVSLYADGEILETFRPELDGFVIKKNAVYLPYDRALPEKVLESIVQRCFEAE